MTDLTFFKVEAEVRRLAAENPDYTYWPTEIGECFYVPTDGSDACIFGQALISLDPEFFSSSHYDMTDIQDVFAQNDIVLTGTQELWAFRVQSLQDSGQTWSNAVESADSLYPLND